MARPRWIASVMAALASTGLALSQQPAMPIPAANDQVGTVITVQEANRPAQKCIVIKSWTTREGARAHLVTALDSGESITIVEAGPSSTPQGDSSSRSVATRIFHWGRNNTPPSGAPMAPADAGSVACAPCTATGPATVACTPCETTAPAIAKPEPAKKSYWPSFLTKKTEMPAAETKPAAFTTDDPKAAPAKIATVSVKKTDDDKKVAKDDLPKADKQKPDPLKLPEKPIELTKATQLPAAAPATDNMFIPERGHVQLPPPPGFPQAPQPNQRLANGAAIGHNMPPNGFNSQEEYATYAENNPSDRMINAFTPVNPAPAAGGPGILAQGGGPRGMMPAAAGRPVAMPAMPAMPYNGPNQLAYAAGTHGTTPMGVVQAAAQVPAGYPSNTTVIPASWQQPATASQTAMPGVVPAMHQDAQSHLLTLNDSIYPSQREMAAEQLAKLDPRTQPHVVSALAKACTADPAATVRAACVRCLAKMNAQGPEVTAAFQAAKADKDPRVQQEAKLALQTPVAGR